MVASHKICHMIDCIYFFKIDTYLHIDEIIFSLDMRR